MRVAIGKESKRFISESGAKTCIVGGVRFEEHRGFDDCDDGDIVFGAICHAFSTLGSAELIFDFIEQIREKEGITDSSFYVKELTNRLREESLFPKGSVKEKSIQHVAILIEGKEPRVFEKIEQMRANIAEAMGIDLDAVGVTVNAGAGLSDVECGEGMSATCIMTAV